jgi:ferredoxin-NADP reductase
MKAVIEDFQWVSHQALAFRLSGLGGLPLPTARPGSHIKVTPPGGEKGAPFSLTSPPNGEPGYEIVVTRGSDGGNVSRWLLEEGARGRTVEISQPRCGLPREKAAPHHVLVAGGTGLTAFLAHLSSLRADGASYELHYAVRSREEAIRLDGLKAAHGSRIRVYPSAEGARLDVAGLVRRVPDDSHLYVCGPPRLVQTVVDEAAEVGWSGDAIHWDRFGWQPEQPRTAMRQGAARPVEA